MEYGLIINNIQYFISKKKKNKLIKKIYVQILNSSFILIGKNK